MNAEPLLFKTFQEFDFVPKVYGFCGRMVVVEDCGTPLYEYLNLNWYRRAFLAYQLLDLAESFTLDHHNLKLYMTDLSVDNIVVNRENLRIYVVDLGDGILQRRFDNESASEVHYSEHFDDEDYAYSKDDVCLHKISDHNIYGVCRLMLSKYAVYPSLKNGILHSPPDELRYHKIFHLIESCVYTQTRESRFDLSKQIKNHLKELLVTKEYFRPSKRPDQ